MSNRTRTLASFYSQAKVYRLFLRLAPDSRRGLALRILRNQKVLADLYDHFLIQKALHEPGRSVSWETHVRKARQSPPAFDPLTQR